MPDVSSEHFAGLPVSGIYCGLHPKFYQVCILDFFTSGLWTSRLTVSRIEKRFCFVLKPGFASKLLCSNSVFHFLILPRVYCYGRDRQNEKIVQRREALGKYRKGITVKKESIATKDGYQNWTTAGESFLTVNELGGSAKFTRMHSTQQQRKSMVRIPSSFYIFKAAADCLCYQLSESPWITEASTSERW